MWEERLKIYDHIVAQCANFERKGKNMIYTSANGYMFTLLNKDAEIGIRLSKPSQETLKRNIIPLNIDLMAQLCVIMLKYLMSFLIIRISWFNTLMKVIIM